jgi:hypothetical protein
MKSKANGQRVHHVSSECNLRMELFTWTLDAGEVLLRLHSIIFLYLLVYPTGCRRTLGTNTKLSKKRRRTRSPMLASEHYEYSATD